MLKNIFHSCIYSFLEKMFVYVFFVFRAHNLFTYLFLMSLDGLKFQPIRHKVCLSVCFCTTSTNDIHISKSALKQH